MESLQAIRIRGVRSFSPDVTSDIKFHKPLTIIVVFLYLYFFKKFIIYTCMFSSELNDDYDDYDV